MVGPQCGDETSGRPDVRTSSLNADHAVRIAVQVPVQHRFKVKSRTANGASIHGHLLQSSANWRGCITCTCSSTACHTTNRAAAPMLSAPQ